MQDRHESHKRRENAKQFVTFRSKECACILEKVEKIEGVKNLMESGGNICQ